jgi:hypothetical protein
MASKLFFMRFSYNICLIFGRTKTNGRHHSAAVHDAFVDDPLLPWSFSSVWFVQTFFPLHVTAIIGVAVPPIGFLAVVASFA